MLIEKPPKWFRKLFPGALFKIESEKGEKTVYLTFDDGPIPEVTPEVLDTLDKYGVKATFFMVGQNVERHPELLEEILKRGHKVGNHTLHHLKGLFTKTERYLEDVKLCEELTNSGLFRPPHGLLRRAQLKSLRQRYKVVMYDLITRDYSKRLTSRDVLNNVKKHVRDGSIIVFHDSLKSRTKLKEALPASIEWLKEQGYGFGLIENDKQYE